MNLRTLLPLLCSLCLRVYAADPLPSVSPERLPRVYVNLTNARLTIEGKPLQPDKDLEKAARALAPANLQKECRDAALRIRAGTATAAPRRLINAYPYLRNAQLRLFEDREEDLADLLAAAKTRTPADARKAVDAKCTRIEGLLFNNKP